MQTMLFVFLLLLPLLSEGVGTHHAYRKIPGRVPIIPEAILNEKIVGKSQDECMKQCSEGGFVDFFYSHQDVLNAVGECNCLPKNLWYKHGLVAANADLYISLSGDGILKNFMFLAMKPVAGKIVTDKALKTTIEECALTCFNYRGREMVQYDCKAFQFDFISGECSMYSESRLRKGGLVDEPFVNGVNVIYFEKIGYFERYYIPTPAVKLSNGHEPLKRYSGEWVQNCSRECAQSPECVSFNYFPEKKTCELLTQNRNAAVTLRKDTDCVHFEMIPSTGCGSGRSDADWGLIRSPGWPNQVSQDYMQGKSCSWDFLTPWGKSIKLNFLYVYLDSAGGSCTQYFQIGNSEKECYTKAPSSKTYGQNGEITTFNFTAKEWPRNSEEKVGFLVSYSQDWTVNTEMRETGVIANPGFPKDMKQTKSNWKIVADYNQEVEIKFLFFDLNHDNKYGELAELTFTPKNGKPITCTGKKIISPCKETLDFKGSVTVFFQAGDYHSKKYPPGFKFLYSVGDSYKDLPDLKNSVNMILTDKLVEDGQNIINKTNLQMEFGKVDYSISIKNPDADGIIELRILNLFLAESEVTNECIKDSLTVVDPHSENANFTFCGHSLPQEAIYSTGNELLIKIKVDVLPFTMKYKPERTYVIEALKRNIKKINTSLIETEETISISPNEYRHNLYMQWIIKGTNNMEPKLVFQYSKLAEFEFKDKQYCDSDRLKINNAVENITSCGHDKSLAKKEIFTNRNEIEITFTTDDIISGVGFSADVKMVSTSRCNPSKVVEVQADEVEYLMSYNYPAIQSSNICSWLLLTENNTGVLITVHEGGKLSTKNYATITNSGLQADANVDEKTTYHVPNGTVISWTGSANNKLLASIDPSDLTTTPEPTTTQTTTTTTSTTTTTTKIPTTTMTETTTIEPSTSTSTTQAPAPKFGANRDTKDYNIEIGTGVGAFVLFAIVLAIIVWKVHASRRPVERIEAASKFDNSPLYMPPEEVIQNYRNQHAFENRAYEGHQTSVNAIDEIDYDDGSVYVEMGSDTARSTNVYPNLNLNSSYGTSNVYDDEYTN